MSGKLVSKMDGLHDIQDDLESSIYVLLWMTLMYSKCSNPKQVPSFLEGVLDPKPHGGTGVYSKPDFLKGRTFLSQIEFTGRSALHCLIDQLCYLFAVRYEQEPSQAERDEATTLRQYVDLGNSQLARVYHRCYANAYNHRMASLKNNKSAIDLFEDALRDPSLWPTNDGAVKQNIRVETSSPHPVIKTGWSTTIFVEELEGGLCSGAVTIDGDPYQMVDEETSSEDTDSSDQTTEDSPTPSPPWDLDS